MGKVDSLPEADRPLETCGDDECIFIIMFREDPRTKIPLLNIIVFGFTRAKI
jgi:hypothetical protein